MKYVKTILCILLVSVLVASYAPAMEVEASNTPVWRVAWITLPEVTATLNNAHIRFELCDLLRDEWIFASGEFKNFIEYHTDGAVNIEIHMIEVAPTYLGTSADRFPNWLHAIGNEGVLRYRLYLYDSLIIGMPGDFNIVGWPHGWAMGSVGTVVLQPYPLHIMPPGYRIGIEFTRIAIHEFLHLMEHWFLDVHNYPLPPRGPTGLGSSIDVGLHRALYFGFYWWSATYSPLGWYAAYFQQSIPNPHYGSAGNTLPRYLGIPREAWQRLPPSQNTITIHPGNGEPSISLPNLRFQRIDLNEFIPTPPTKEHTFLGWYLDATFTRRFWSWEWGGEASLRFVESRSFYARWGILGQYEITLEPNNGTAPTVEVGRVGRVFERPADPEPTAQTYGMVFRGWYSDAGFTRPVWFPHTVLRHVTFYARWAERGTAVIVPSDDSLAYIDLTNEELTLPHGFIVGAHSINGGRTWSTRIIPRERFYRMLNRELHLVVVDEWDRIARRPADGARTITFEPIQRRPRANVQRLRLNYLNFADPTAFTPGFWSLAPRGIGAAVYEGYEIVIAGADRRPAIASATNLIDWQPMPPNGIAVLPFGSVRERWFVRSAPVAADSGGVFIPASRPFRVNPATQRRALRLRPNYNTGIFRLSAGRAIFGGSMAELASGGSQPAIAASSADFAPGRLFVATREDRNGVSISPFLGAYSGSRAVSVWLPATARQPSSQVQEYVFAR